jgi:hypothetical protein
VAFLYLNSRGHDALILDEVNLTHPDVRLLAGRSMRYPPSTSGQSLGRAGRWRDSAMYRSIFPRRVLHARISMPNPQHRRTQFDDRTRLRTNPQLSARTLALRAPLESPSAEYAGLEYLSKEFCRCTALDSRSRPIRTRARSRSGSRATPTI